MSKQAISIIVPIYNMQHLMRRCIDSILAQQFTNYELILVNDGSTDNSGNICNEYIEKDPRIKVLHKQNGGLSDARNYGLAQASGKYTIFADPDDYLSPTGLEQLYNEAEAQQADITICDIYKEDKHTSKYVSQRPSSLSADVVLKELFCKIGGFTVNKLIRRDLYERYDIKYPIGIYGCEDDYVMAQFLLHQIKLAYIPVAFYHYMYNPNSLTRYYDEQTYEIDVKILNMFTTLLKGTEAEQYAYNEKYNTIFTHAFWSGRRYYSSKSFKKQFAHYRKRVMTFNEYFIVRIAMYLSCLGAYGLSHYIIKLLFNIKRKIKKYIIGAYNTIGY